MCGNSVSLDNRGNTTRAIKIAIKQLSSVLKFTLVQVTAQTSLKLNVLKRSDHTIFFTQNQSTLTFIKNAFSATSLTEAVPYITTLLLHW
ncbi:MAG: hypothetical protein PUP91_37720 [Rhizonema sp. PD37]|nr:hypothetical protein [Rhizonema sp. PD37]